MDPRRKNWKDLKGGKEITIPLRQFATIMQTEIILLCKKEVAAKCVYGLITGKPLESYKT